MAYTQDQINAAYATERANGASDADLQRIGAEKYGVSADQFTQASQAYGTTPDQSAFAWAPSPASSPVASAPAAAPADRFTQAQYDTARGWADGKTFDEIGAKAKELGLSASEVGKIFGEHGGSADQVMNLSKYGTAGWDGFQDEAKKWTFKSNEGWLKADPKAPPKTGINLSQLQGMTRWDVTPNETVRSQLQQIIADDSPLMQQARARAMQSSNARGLLNSSMAATAGESALYDAAMPIAQQDASTYARSGEFNANTANTFSRDNNAFVRDAYMADFNVGANEWAAQQQWDRDYKTLDRQQQLQLERDAIQAGYQTARDQFAAQNQLSIAQLDAASRAASVQPDTSMARLQLQMQADDKKTAQNIQQDNYKTLNAARSSYNEQVAAISTKDLSQEVKDATIRNLTTNYNDQAKALTGILGITPGSWVINLDTAVPAPAPAPAPAVQQPTSGEAGSSGE